MSPCSVSGPRRHPVSLDPRHLSDPGTRAAEQVVPAEHAGSKSRILRAEEKTCFYGGRFHWFRLKYFVLACTHTHAHTCLRAEVSLLTPLCVGKFRMARWFWLKPIGTLYWKTSELHGIKKADFVMKYWYVKTVISAYFLTKILKC